MKIIPAAEAWENLVRNNPFCRWHTARENADFGNTANARLSSGAFVAEYEPTLRIKAGDKAFCIGSCFARNVESALRENGVVVESGVTDELILSPSTFTIFNTYSMLNELRWALEPEYALDDSLFLKGEGGFIDPHINLAAARDLDRCRLARHRIVETTRRIKECDFVILTLGLVEAWYDRDNKLYLNSTPPRSLALATPGRFELHRLDSRQNREALEEILRLIKRHCKAAVQLILTVSPIPFLATFSNDDVVVANGYSKSVLRTVAQEYADKDPDVHYIPVYDSIVNTDPDIAWIPDRQNAEMDIVRLNIGNFLSKVLADEGLRLKALSEVVRLKELLAVRRKTLKLAAAPQKPVALRLPVFDVDDVDEAAFPAGRPTITASSSMSDEFRPGNLMSGNFAPWHSAKNPTFPQTIDVVFPKGLRCVRLWMQSQNRYPERAPLWFALSAGLNAGNRRESTPFLAHKWTSGDEWASFDVAFKEAWPFFRLTILAALNPELITLQRMWLEPDTWREK